MFNKSHQNVGHFVMGKHKLQSGLKSTKCYFNLENLKRQQAESLLILLSKEKSWMIILITLFKLESGSGKEIPAP